MLLLCCLLFFLSTGHSKPQLIKRIVFKGNSTISSSEIQRIMILKEGSVYDPFLLERDLESILELYYSKGFPDAEVIQEKLTPTDGEVNCEFLVKEGERIKTTTIQVIGNETISTEEISRTLGFAVGSPFDPDMISLGEYKIESLYEEKGYIYADATANLIRQDRSASVIFAVQEGPRVKIGQIRIDGNLHTRRTIIEREIVVKPGDVYDPKRIYRSQQKLYATNLFKDVDFEVVGVKDSSEVVHLLFRVEEVSPRWISFGFGCQSPDRVLGNIKVGHDNLFNNGQKLSASTFFSYNLRKEDEESIELQYLEPYLMSTLFRLTARAFHNREHWLSYSQWETGANATIGRYLTENLRFFVQYQYKTVHIDTIKGSVEGITNSVLFSLLRDTRDNVFNPLRGTYTSLTLETAGGFLGGSNNFGRSILDFSGFVNPTDRLILGLKLKFGELSPFGESEEEGVSLNERFELGGASSMRGYEEASIGPMDARKKHSGNVMISSNAELRHPLWGKLWMGLFIDSGGIWMHRKEIDPSDLKFSCGVGLRYSLPIGPLRLDYARKLTGATPGELGRLYLAIGHIF